ncbi:IclR family transcriptional regulator [Nocardia sp. NPDC004568]|uniref:IclR family transcriptional regulator n=1 Tax=Nocardia sp. NPDC004568 TaxID=3154551 RepID=UPI0033B68375
MSTTAPKTPPAYVVTSADHALRAAVMLQLEGGSTVSQVAERLGVARSTAHRLLQTLVYRDFAVQDEQRVYHPGPVLELATHSQSRTSRLRAAALPHLQRLVDLVGESANLTIRAGDTARFIASVECRQALRVGSREGMVFPAHRTTAGLVLLAELEPAELDELYDEARYAERPDERPDLPSLRAQLAKVRRAGFALNDGLSERGVVAVGVPVREADGTALAGLSVSMPSVRYLPSRLPTLVATLHRAAGGIEADRGADRGTPPQPGRHE